MGAHRDELLRRARCLPAQAGFRGDMAYSNIGYSIARQAAAGAGGDGLPRPPDALAHWQRQFAFAAVLPRLAPAVSGSGERGAARPRRLRPSALLHDEPSADRVDEALAAGPTSYE